MKINKPIISLAPLQGFTDYTYRNAMHEIIGGVDKYYTPYLRLQNDNTLKNKNIKDILAANNSTPVIPQILVNNSSDFIQLAQEISDHGYTELNLNLGCPYPMVTNRQLGSGLLPSPEKITQLLDESLPKINIGVSIKMRSGLNDSGDIFNILPKLDQFPLNEIIIHPRIAKQLYKGLADFEVFKECLQLSKHKLAYNGDITTKSEFDKIYSEINTVSHFMIGRGLLQNLFLALEIKNESRLSSTEKLEKLQHFHDRIFQFNTQATSGKTHLLNKMIQLWIYFSANFSHPKKVFKAIKKCHSEHSYISLCQAIFHPTNSSKYP